MTGRGFGRDDHPEELLSASVTGDLTAAERSALDAHLAACARCRTTLAAFGEERHLISGMREVPPPRDLGARVRAGIEGRGFALPWWRRPSTLVAGFASLATVAAALLAVVVLSGIPRGGVGNATPTASASASASETPSVEPSESGAPSPQESSVPTTRPAVALAPGELGYLSMDGEPERPLVLSFVNDATGTVTALGEVFGPPLAAATSPTGEFLASINEIGLADAYQVRITRLSDGRTDVLGCTVPRAFADRLAWSSDGRFLAYTMTPIDMGQGVDCGSQTGDGSATDAWAYDAAAGGEPIRLTSSGNAFAADFIRGTDTEGGYQLLVSYAAEDPYTEYLRLPTLLPGAEPHRIDGVFLPLLAPDGTAVYWRGTMAQAAEGGWHFVQGGMPYMAADPMASGDDHPLFDDLQPVGGAGFDSGQFGWSPDGNLLGFWSGEWTGAPQSDDGSFPSSRDVYVWHVLDGRRDARARVPRIVTVTFDGVRALALVTVAQPSAGDLSIPASTLYSVPLSGDASELVGVGASWSGPAVIGEEAVPNR